ncbi:hypothetical protein C6A85_11120, partial [Mycobacterium sp. ITM-2017-0098]
RGRFTGLDIDVVARQGRVIAARVADDALAVRREVGGDLPRQIDLDVIVYATGYHLDFLSTVDIRGREGRKLTEEWGDSPRS